MKRKGKKKKNQGNLTFTELPCKIVVYSSTLQKAKLKQEYKGQTV
jgi:hypothetical protein